MQVVVLLTAAVQSLCYRYCLHGRKYLCVCVHAHVHLSEWTCLKACMLLLTHNIVSPPPLDVFFFWGVDARLCMHVCVCRHTMYVYTMWHHSTRLPWQISMEYLEHVLFSTGSSRECRAGERERDGIVYTIMNSFDDLYQFLRFFHKQVFTFC